MRIALSLVPLLAGPAAALAAAPEGGTTELLALEEAELRALTPDFQDNYGAALSADGNRLAVGSPRGESGNRGASVLVYLRAGTRWDLEAELFPSVANTYAEFGKAVALDGERLLVGAPGTDLVGTHGPSGAAFVFVRQGSAWVEEARLEPVPEINEVEFGAAVALDGDVAVVGARHDDLAATGAGSCYVFRRSGTTWTMEDRLVAADLQAGWELGSSVDVEGDQIVAGAWLAAPDQAGAVYVFRRLAGVWTETQKLEPPDVTGNDLFGIALDLEGTTLVVGARGNGLVASSSGAVYVHRDDGTAWAAVQRLIPADVGFQSRFGSAVAMHGGRIVGGAPNHRIGGPLGPRPGAAWVFEPDGALWTEVAMLWKEHPTGLPQFGAAVDVDAERAYTGMPDASHETVDLRGKAFVWRLREPAPGASLCPGDGTGAACPCGNESAEPGTGCAHSGGVGSRLTAWGSSSVAADDLLLVAADLPPENSGVFYCGKTSLDPGAPLFDGLQCAGGDVRRFEPRFQTTGCTTDTGFVAQDPSGVYFAPGAQTVFQYWSRDVSTGASPCGTFRTFSNGWSVTWTP